jgi:acyl transferase domain-containing protein/NADPH:quinone reductase-like Zn-dependent oxidoreductase/NADP-dependent 3-hydroxy acid dehydrogenase YdfG/acyl carrier protein
MAALGEVVASLPLADVAYTLSNHRSKFLFKAFAVVDTSAPAEGLSSPPDSVVKSAPTQSARIGFVFTGQGAQWQEMGRALFEYHVFRSSITALDQVLAGLSIAPSWSLLDILSGGSARSVQEAEISQAACAALQIGIVDLLRSWGINPHVTVGHSSGEMAAAYASGRVSRSEAIVLAYCRAKAVSFNSQKGAMLAVGVGHDEATVLLKGCETQIKIAALNSPRSVTLSGDADAIGQLHKKLQAEGAFARLLPTDGIAYHSHHMVPLGDTYEKLLNQCLSEIKVDLERPPLCSWVSTVTPDTVPVVEVAYWRKNLEGSVLFSPAVERLIKTRDTQVDIIVEIGPHSALQSPIKQILSQAAAEHSVKQPVYLSALRRFDDGMHNLLSLCGALFQLNHGVDIAAVNAIDRHGRHGLEYVHGRVCTEMPTYRYSYGPILHHESRIGRELRERPTLHHDLLGSIRPGGSKDQPVWRNILRLSDVPWLSHHRLLPNAVLPGAAYVCLAIEAASQYVRGRRTDFPIVPVFKLRNVQIKAALIIPDDEFGVEILTSINVSMFSKNWLEFKVTSVDNAGTWSDHAAGLISVAASPARETIQLKRLDNRMDKRYIDVQKWYSKFEEMGLGYGKSFQGLDNLLTDPYKNIATAELNMNTTAGMFTGPESKYAIHPATLDICFQAAIIALHGGQTGRMKNGYIPLVIEEMSVWPASGEEVTGEVIVQSEKRGIRHSLSQIQVVDQFGLPRVDLKPLRGVSYYGGKDVDNTPQPNEYTRLAWKPDISRLSSAQTEAIFTSMPVNGLHGRLTGLIDLMGHRDPNMRILQVGANNDVSALILSALGGHTNTMRYDTFTVAGNSSANLGDAETSLSSFNNVAIQCSDLENDDDAQGLSVGYDLIVAANGLDSADETSAVLQRLRVLIKTGGRLLLLNSARGPDDWSSDLTENGFSGVDIALDNDKQPRSILVSTARPMGAAAPTSHTSAFVYIIHKTGITAFQQAIAAELRRRRNPPIIASLFAADGIPAGSRVIMTVDLEAGGLLDASEEEYNMIKLLAQKASSLLWLAKGDIITASEPKSAIATGLMRILTTERQESRFGIFHLEEASLDATKSSAARLVIEQETRLHEGDSGLECALHDGVEYIPRLVYDSGLSSRHRVANSTTVSIVDAPIHSQGPVVVDFASPGLLSSAYFKPNTAISGPLRDDWIEIKTAAISLNWKDLSMASGRATSRMDWDSCNCECSGTIVACGTGVKELKPGDRVYALAWSWFGTHIRIPARLAQKMELDDTFEQMSTVPVAFCTAVYGLVHLGRLRKGQRVLIQTATGGFGLAALQVAKACGADIFTTVGTPEKRAYLREHCGIPEDRIFSSRDEAAIDSMVAATGGKGFNVILSTSTGDMLHAAWRCIAPRGYFIDVGRLDVVDHSAIELGVFERNATFSSFDLSILTRQDPEFAAELMQEVGSMLRAGTIRPIDAIQTFDVSKLDFALLSLSKGKHIGKFVVSCENPNSVVKMTVPVPRASFDPNAEYVIVGGLGGFGRSILRWLVVRGARHLTVFRRSAALDREAQILIEDLASEGATVNLMQVDVTVRAQVEAALSEVSRRYPVKGLLHAAMNPVDTTFDRLPYETWKFALSCKVEGTINLHEASLALGLPLDFFVLTGSIMSAMALPAHVGYCTANAFQDAFSRYRKSLGLPSCTIGFGLITEVTAIARRDATLSLNKRNHIYSTGELETLQLLEAAFIDSPAEADGSYGWQGFDPLAAAQLTAYWDPWKLAGVRLKGPEPVWHSNKKFSHVVRALKHQLSASDQLTQSKAAKPAVVGDVDAAIRSEMKEEAVRIATMAILERIAELLEIEVESMDAGRSVAEYGVDSLVAVELRSWIMATFHKAVPLLKLLDERMSITNLAEAVVAERAEVMSRSS